MGRLSISGAMVAGASTETAGDYASHSHSGHLGRVWDKSTISPFSRLKSVRGGRIVLAATCRAAQPAKLAAKRQAVPRVPCDARKMLRNWPRGVRSGGRVKELKEIGYGKQQAGAEYPGFLPEHRPQREIEHHDLLAEWGEADRAHSVLRQVFRGA